GSSDVCSSDLDGHNGSQHTAEQAQVAVDQKSTVLAHQPQGHHEQDVHTTHDRAGAHQIAPLAHLGHAQNRGKSTHKGQDAHCPAEVTNYTQQNSGDHRGHGGNFG